jgi:hypothetical protein
MTRERPAQFAGERTRIASIVKLDVVQRQALGTQGLGKVAHRREHEDELLLVMGRILGFIAHLSHEHNITRVVHVAQGTDRPT